jgi:hypothetical protein
MTDPEKWNPRIHRALNDEQAKIWAADRRLERVRSPRKRKSILQQISHARCRICFLVMLAQSAAAGPPSPPGLTTNLPPLPGPVYKFTPTNWIVPVWEGGVFDPTNRTMLHQYCHYLQVFGVVSTNKDFEFVLALRTNYYRTNCPEQRDVMAGSMPVVWRDKRTGRQ